MLLDVSGMSESTFSFVLLIRVHTVNTSGMTNEDTFGMESIHKQAKD